MIGWLILAALALVAAYVIAAMVWPWFRVSGHDEGKDPAAGLKRNHPKA
jgi:hypothetical protein